ncbi:MAG: lysophospholipid acyltransferase family protein [Desulfovibrio sp.]|nr:lysophospholipid acyltransferase family protein [Desulfovibrio sp.]
MRTQESFLRDILRLVIWYPFRWLVRLLPVSAGIWCITRLGDLHYALSRRKRRWLYDNLLRLQPSIPPIRAHEEIRRYLRVHYLNQLIILVFPSLDLVCLQKLLAWRGLEHLDAAQAQGRGVVLAHPHFGPVHLPLFALGALGYPVKQIGKPSDAGLSWIGRRVAFKLRMRYEGKIPAEIIPVGSDYRAVFKHLRAGHIVMITADGAGDLQQHGKFTPLTFCGHTVQFPLGAAKLAMRTNSVLLPLFVHPGTSTPWQCSIEKEICIPRNADSDTAAENAARQFVERYEQYVAAWPGCMHFLDTFAPGLLITDQEPGGASTSLHESVDKC